MLTIKYIFNLSILFAALCVISGEQPPPVPPAGATDVSGNATKPVVPAVNPESTTKPISPPVKVENNTQNIQPVPASVPVIPLANDTTSTTTIAPTTQVTTVTSAPNNGTNGTITSTTSTTPSTPATTTTTTVAPPVTPSAATTPTTTVLPSAAPVAPSKDRSFDGMSFIGGMVLTIGLMAIGVIGFKYYKTRGDSPNYFTL